MSKEKVKFVKDHDGDVTAIFPELADTRNGIKYITCYAHIGQHSECVQGWIDTQVEATEHEYHDLKEELESIGYDLEVIA